MTVNDDSRVVNKLEASLTDNARVVIYDRHMFIVKATGLHLKHSNFWASADVSACLLCLSLWENGNEHKWERIIEIVVYSQ